MRRRPPGSTRTDTLFPYTTLFRSFRFPARHPDDAIIDVEIEVTDEPVPHLAHRQPVTHHHRPRADEAFPAGLQQRSLDGAPRRVRPIEHPHRSEERRGGKECVRTCRSRWSPCHSKKNKHKTPKENKN